MTNQDQDWVCLLPSPSEKNLPVTIYLGHKTYKVETPGRNSLQVQPGVNFKSMRTRCWLGSHKANDKDNDVGDKRLKNNAVFVEDILCSRVHILKGNEICVSYDYIPEPEK